MKGQQYFDIAVKYAKDVADGKIRRGNNLRECLRFLADLKKKKKWDIRTKDSDFVCGFIEQFFVHEKGEDMKGHSLKNRPLKLEPWEIFIVVNLLCFYKKGTDERRSFTSASPPASSSQPRVPHNASPSAGTASLWIKPRVVRPFCCKY